MAAVDLSNSSVHSRKPVERPVMTQLTMKAKQLTSTKGTSFFHLGHLNGSFGSSDGCGIKIK